MNLTISLFGRRVWESRMARLLREDAEANAERQAILDKNARIALAAEIRADLDKQARIWQRNWEIEQYKAEQASAARRTPCRTWWDSDMQRHSTC